MDILPLAGMVFSLLVVIIIAGSVLMFPVMRRLARFLELRIEERHEGGLPADEIEALKTTVDSLREELSRVSDRQAFTERLLEAPQARSGTTGPDAGAGDPAPAGSPAAEAERP